MLVRGGLPWYKQLFTAEQSYHLSLVGDQMVLFRTADGKVIKRIEPIRINYAPDWLESMTPVF